MPYQKVALTVDQIADLNRRLGMLRHNINNQLALIVTATEMLRCKPEMSEHLVENILRQPERISAEMRAFSDQFEATLGITHNAVFAAPAPAFRMFTP